MKLPKSLLGNILLTRVMMTGAPNLAPTKTRFPGSVSSNRSPGTGLSGAFFSACSGIPRENPQKYGFLVVIDPVRCRDLDLELVEPEFN